jgi:hypothetical protein
MERHTADTRAQSSNSATKKAQPQSCSSCLHAMQVVFLHLPQQTSAAQALHDACLAPPQHHLNKITYQ